MIITPASSSPEPDRRFGSSGAGFGKSLLIHSNLQNAPHIWPASNRVECASLRRNTLIFCGIHTTTAPPLQNHQLRAFHNPYRQLLRAFREDDYPVIANVILYFETQNSFQRKGFRQLVTLPASDTTAPKASTSSTTSGSR